MPQKVSHCETFVNRKVSNCPSYIFPEYLENEGMDNRIKEFRRHKDMSQDVLADRIHVSKATISKLEKGQQPFTQLYMEKIAAVVGCKAYELIMPIEDSIALAATPSTASGIVDAYESLSEGEKRKAKGFLQFLFDQEEKTQAPQKEKKTTKSSGC